MLKSSKMKTLFYLASLLIFVSCIGEDIVDDFISEEVRITSTLNEITISNTEQLSVLYFNNVGIEENATILWESSNTDILTVTQEGIVEGEMVGEATITASVGDFSDEITITVINVGDESNGELAEITGNIRTTSSYDLTGDFTLSEIEGGDLNLSFTSNYDADTGLPGLYVYLTNNPNSVQNAIEIGKVEVFNGEHSYTIPNTGLNEYAYILYWCKPFSVKVGQGDLDN